VHEEVQAQVGPELDILRLYHQSWHPDQKETSNIMTHNGVKHTKDEEEKMKNEEGRREKKKREEGEEKVMMIQ
jgi:hypothetical protein